MACAGRPRRRPDRVSRRGRARGPRARVSDHCLRRVRARRPARDPGRGAQPGARSAAIPPPPARLGLHHRLEPALASVAAMAQPAQAAEARARAAARAARLGHRRRWRLGGGKSARARRDGGPSTAPRAAVWPERSRRGTSRRTGPVALVRSSRDGRRAHRLSQRLRHSSCTRDWHEPLEIRHVPEQVVPLSSACRARATCRPLASAQPARPRHAGPVAAHRGTLARARPAQRVDRLSAALSVPSTPWCCTRAPRRSSDW